MMPSDAAIFAVVNGIVTIVVILVFERVVAGLLRTAELQIALLADVFDDYRIGPVEPDDDGGDKIVVFPKRDAS